MAASGLSLVSNGNVVADGAYAFFPGGRAVIVAMASSFPTTCQVQMKGKDDSTAISVGSNLTANGISSGIDLPPGQYRIHCTGGTETALYVDLVSVPYR